MKQYSIIIPTWNEAESIYDFLMALQPLREQCELIIADAGSTDATQTIARPFVDQIITGSKGRARQMNAGAENAATAVFIFLHADTYLPGQALQLIQQGIDKGAQWGRFDIQLTGCHRMLKVIASMMNWRSRLTGIATGDQVLFMTRQAYQAVSGFPEIALMEDIAISKQLKRLVPPYCIYAKVRSSARRWESFGLWKTIALMWSLRLRYFLGTSPDQLAALYRQGEFRLRKK